MVSADFLYYNTPIAELKNHYGDDFEQPFKNKITTQLPQNVALIRLAAIAFFGTLLALSSPAWIWPVVVLGSAAYAGWVVYSHLLQKDPLVEAFYKIVGGKEQYEELPEIVLVGEKVVAEELQDLKWDALDQPMYRAKTEDGRRILIVKAMTRDPEQDLLFAAQAKTIFAFVEKLGPADLKPSTLDFTPENSRRFDAFLHGFNVMGGNENLFGPEWRSQSSGGSSGGSIRKHSISASMTSDKANEFFAQMKERVE